jgi:hypothetical protein
VYRLHYPSPEIISIAEYLNTEYKQDQFVKIVTSHESNQPNMNSTIKTAAKVVEELNQSSENSNTKEAHNTQKQN